MLEILKIKKAILLIAFFIFPWMLFAQEQEKKYSFEFRGERLSTALDEVAQKTGIDLVYDPELISNIYVYEDIDKKPVSEVLNIMLAETEVDYLTLSSGTFVIIETVLDRPSRGTYHGRIVDKETGEPLPGATVMLADASGGTQSGQTGRFSMDDMVSGTYEIIFSYVGYQPVTKKVEVEPDEAVREEIEMEPKPVDFSPVVVTGHQPRMPNKRSDDESLSLEDEWISGAGSEPIQSLNLFSGVQYGLPMTDLHLQGGQQGEHRILLDGVPLYNPQSFGDLYSSLSPHAIDRAEIHKAGFGIPGGSQIAGIIDLKHGLYQQENAVLTQGDPLSLNLRGDMQLMEDNGNRLKVMGAVRSNYWDLYQEPSLRNTLRKWDDLDPLMADFMLDDDSEAFHYRAAEHQADVKFYDVHLASEYQLDDHRTLSGSVYVGKNSVGSDLLSRNYSAEDVPEYLYARDEYSWNNVLGQITYDVRLNPRMDLTSKFSYTSNRFRQRYLLGNNEDAELPPMGSDDEAYGAFQEGSTQSQIPTQHNKNSIDHLILQSDATYSINPSLNLEAGLQLDYVSSFIDFSDLFYLPTLSDQTSFFASSYLNGNWQASEQWKLTAGSRLTYYAPANRLYPEPRATVQYDRPDADIGYWSARLSGGLYRQFVNQYEVTNPGPTSLVPSFPVWSHAASSELPKAWHLSGSYLLEPSENTSIKLEGYHKWQPTSYIISYNNLLEGVTVNRSDFEAFATTISMKSYGGSARINQSALDARLNIMAGYDYNMTLTEVETQFGESLEAPWNEPHRLQFRLLGHLNEELSVVARWQSILGRKWGYRQAYYDFLFSDRENGYNFKFTNPEDDRLSPFHQLDLSFIYRPDFSFADTEFRLDLVNLLNRTNTIDWSLRPSQPDARHPADFEKKPRTMPGFSPSLSVQLEF